MAKLKKFEGREVVYSAMKITKAGDGLSEALQLAPVELHHGDEVSVVLRGVVRSVNYVPLKPGDDDCDLLVRSHTVVTEEITIVELDDVQGALNQAAEKLAALRDEAAGREPLPGMKPGENDSEDD
jgi:hypothetical protein